MVGSDGETPVRIPLLAQVRLRQGLLASRHLFFLFSLNLYYAEWTRNNAKVATGDVSATQRYALYPERMPVPDGGPHTVRALLRFHIQSPRQNELIMIAST